MPEPTVATLLLVLLGAALAGFTQGFGGFGLGLVAVSVFTLVSPDPAVMLVVITVFAIGSMLLVLALSAVDRCRAPARDEAERATAGIDRGAIVLLLAGVVPGFLAGHWIVIVFGTSAWFTVAVGIALAGMGVHGLFGAASASRLTTRPLGPLYGVTGGTLLGSMASGGPFLVLYLRAQCDDPRAMKPPLQIIFLGTAFARLGFADASGIELRDTDYLWMMLTTSVVLAMTVVGHRTARRVSAASFTRVVFGFVAVAGTANIARGVAQLL